MSILKTSIAIVVAIALLLAFVATISGVFSNEIAYIVIALGLVWFIINILSNIRKQSRIKVGAINRGEFYSIIVVIMGWLFIMNNRIDSLFQILIDME